MTSFLSLVREGLILFLPNADITRQQEVFWACVRITFIISAFAAWWIQYRKANRFSKLDIEFKDIFLTYIRPLGEWNDDNAKTFLTVVFSITNFESAVNTIKSCRFILYKNQRFFIKTDKIELEKRNVAFLKNGEAERRLGSLDTIIFEQNISQDYAATFNLYEDNISDENAFADKSFTVLLIDSYGREYKKRGRTPKNLMKTLVRFHF